MNAQLLVSSLLGLAGVACAATAIYCERRMHRHRRPGISYADATLRRDGGWQRADLFTEDGLRYQRRASAFGVLGAALWLGALLAWIAFGVAR